MAYANRTFRSGLLLTTACAALTALPSAAYAQLVTSGDLDLASAFDSAGNGGPAGAGAAGVITVADRGGTNITDITLQVPVVIANWNRFNVVDGTVLEVGHSLADPTATATLFNRVIGPDMSLIAGTINSPNVNLWLLNQNGIMFGSDASINAASFLATTLGATDNDLFDFAEGTDAAGNGSQTVRFSGPAASTSPISGGGLNASFVSDGSLAFFGPRLDLAATFDAGGSISFVAAADVSVQFTPGSPLSYTITAGTTVAEQTIGGSIAGRSVDFRMLTASGVMDAVLRVDATINATTAVATDTGVRLIAEQIDGFGLETVTVEMDGGITSTGSIDLRTDGALTANSAISGSSVGVIGDLGITLDDVTTTAGDALFEARFGDLTAGDVDATGNILFEVEISGAAEFDSLLATGQISTVGFDNPVSITVNGLTRGGSILLNSSNGLDLGDVVATSGRIRLNAGGGALSADDVDAATFATLLGDSISVGDVLARAGAASMFSANDVTAASITSLLDAIVVESNSGGALDLGALDARGTILLDTSGDITASTVSTQGELAVGSGRTPTSVTFTGNVSAGEIDIQANGAFDAAGLTANTGNIDITADTIDTGDLLARLGDVELAATGNITTGSVMANPFSSTAGTISISSTGGGALDLGALTAGTGITLDTEGSITGTTISSRAGPLVIGGTDEPDSVAFTGSLTAADITVDVDGTFSATIVEARTGSIDIDAVSIATGNVRAQTGNVLLVAESFITTGTVTADPNNVGGGTLAVRSTANGALNLGALSAGGDLSLDTGGSITGVNATSRGGAVTIGGTLVPGAVAFSGALVGESVTVDAAGAFSATEITARTGSIDIEALSIAATSVRAQTGNVLLVATNDITTDAINADPNNTVGGTLAIRSTGGGTLDLGALNSGGDLTLDTEGTITGSSATSRGGAVTIGGALVPGAVTFSGGLSADSVTVDSTAAFTAGGITARTGDIDIEALSITTGNLSASVGDVSLAAEDDVTTGAITGRTVSVDTFGAFRGDNVTANAGTVNIAAGAITAGAIRAIGGDVLLLAENAVTTGAIAASRVAGVGGDIVVESTLGGALTFGNLNAGNLVELFTNGAVTTGSIDAVGLLSVDGSNASASVSFGGNAAAGQIAVSTLGAFTGAALTARAGNMRVTARSIAAGDVRATGGDVSLFADEAISAGNITATFTSNGGGAVVVLSSTGTVDLGDVSGTSGISIATEGDIFTGDLTAADGLVSVGTLVSPAAGTVTQLGNVRGEGVQVLTRGALETGTVTATNGSVLLGAESIATQAISATVGFVDLLAEDDVSTGAITATGFIDVDSTAGGTLRLAALRSGGDTTLTSAGDIVTDTITNTAGGIAIDGGTITTAALSATGGDVLLTAIGDVLTTGITARRANNAGGAIAVDSRDGGIDLGALTADLDIRLDAAGTIRAGMVTAIGGALEVGTASSADSVTFTGDASARSIEIRLPGRLTGLGLTATAGDIAIEASAITAAAVQASGGDVGLRASGDILTTGITALRVNGMGGTIDVESLAGALDLGALSADLGIALDAERAIRAGLVTARGGSLDVGAASSVDSVTFTDNATALGIDIRTTGALTAAGLSATAGNIAVDAGSIAAGAVTATGGNVGLTARRRIATGAIGATGSVTVNSTGTGADASDLALGNIRAAQAVTLGAGGAITTGDVTSTGAGIAAGAAQITTGNLVAGAGNVDLTALRSIATGNINATGTITATSTGTGIDAGDLALGSLMAGGNVTLAGNRDIAAGGARSNGGNVAVTALRNIGTGAINANGTITVTSTGTQGADVTVGPLEAGLGITLDADGDIATTGAVASTGGTLRVGMNSSADSVTFGGNVSARAIAVRSTGAVVAATRDMQNMLEPRSMEATAGNIDVTAGSITTGTLDATGGNVALTASGNIATRLVTATRANNAGGTIDIESTGGGLELAGLSASLGIDLDALAGTIAVSGATTALGGAITADARSIRLTGPATATGGDVRLTAMGEIVTGALTSNRAGDAGGTIDVESTGGLLNLGALLADRGIDLDAGGAITTRALTARRGAVDVNGASIAITGATSATGGDVRLLASGAISALSVTATRLDGMGGAIDVDSTNGGAILTGALSSTGRTSLDTLGSVTTGAITAGGDVTVGTDRRTSQITLGGAVQAPNVNVRTNGTFTAAAIAVGTGRVDVLARNVELGGAVTAGNVAIVSAATDTVAGIPRIGLGSVAGVMSLSNTEIGRINAGNLLIDAGNGDIGIAGVTFGENVGRTSVNIATTGMIRITGDVTGSAGTGRTFRIGGTAGASPNASLTGVASRITADIDRARVDLGTNTLELRGTDIVFGQQSTLINRVFSAGSGGGQRLSLTDIVQQLIGNAGSELYTPQNLSAARTAEPTYLVAGQMRVTYGGSALFQNSAPRVGGNAFDGVRLGGAGAPAGPALELLPIDRPVVNNFNVQQGNVFAIFGTINGATGPAAALGGQSVIRFNDQELLIPASRVNGCIIGSAEGCVTTIVGNFILSVPREVVSPIVAEEGAPVPFDPLVGTNNESLFSDAATAPEGDENCRERNAAGECVGN